MYFLIWDLSMSSKIFTLTIADLIKAKKKNVVHFKLYTLEGRTKELTLKFLNLEQVNSGNNYRVHLF